MFSNDLYSSYVFNRLFGKKSYIKEPIMKWKESENDFQIKLEMPGISKDDLNITYEKETVHVKAEKSDNDNFYFYEKYVFVPDINENTIEAKIENGILTVTLTKKEELKPKRIEIK